MPRFVILLSADALAHASVFAAAVSALSWYCQKCDYSVAWQAQQDCAGIACFLLPGNAPMLLNGLNMWVSQYIANVRTDCVLVRWNDHLGILLLV